MENKLKILKKLADARDYIKELDIVKDGRNTFSKYDYFTPVLVSSLVHQACMKFNMTTLFSMLGDEQGLYGSLVLVDLDSGEHVSFEMRTAVPEIKATNITQQYGGAETYTKRYLKMSVFDITDNKMEFDSKDNRKTVKPKLSKGSKAYEKAVEYLKNGGDIRAIENKYEIEDIASLKKDIK